MRMAGANRREAKRTALEECLMNQLADMQTNHEAEMGEMGIKLHQREAAIKTLERALTLRNGAVDEVRDELDVALAKLKEAEAKLKKQDKQLSRRVLSPSPEGRSQRIQMATSSHSSYLLDSLQEDIQGLSSRRGLTKEGSIRHLRDGLTKEPSIRHLRDGLTKEPSSRHLRDPLQEELTRRLDLSRHERDSTLKVNAEPMFLKQESNGGLSIGSNGSNHSKIRRENKWGLDGERSSKRDTNFSIVWKTSDVWKASDHSGVRGETPRKENDHSGARGESPRKEDTADEFDHLCFQPEVDSRRREAHPRRLKRYDSGEGRRKQESDRPRQSTSDATPRRESDRDSPRRQTNNDGPPVRHNSRSRGDSKQRPKKGEVPIKVSLSSDGLVDQSKHSIDRRAKMGGSRSASHRSLASDEKSRSSRTQPRSTIVSLTSDGLVDQDKHSTDRRAKMGDSSSASRRSLASDETSLSSRTQPRSGSAARCCVEPSIPRARSAPRRHAAPKYSP